MQLSVTGYMATAMAAKSPRWRLRSARSRTLGCARSRALRRLGLDSPSRPILGSTVHLTTALSSTIVRLGATRRRRGFSVLRRGCLRPDPGDDLVEDLGAFGFVVELVAEAGVGAALDAGSAFEHRGRPNWHQAVVLAVDHQGRDAEPAWRQSSDASLLGEALGAHPDRARGDVQRIRRCPLGDCRIP